MKIRKLLAFQFLLVISMLLNCASATYQVKVDPNMGPPHYNNFRRIAEAMKYKIKGHTEMIMINVDETTAIHYERSGDGGFNMAIYFDDKNLTPEQKAAKNLELKALGEKIWADAEKDMKGPAKKGK